MSMLWMMSIFMDPANRGWISSNIGSFISMSSYFLLLFGLWPMFPSKLPLPDACWFGVPIRCQLSISGHLGIRFQKLCFLKN